ncbi:MAG: nicotinate phosphoribosyltransferase [Gemmatimonadaceae bacterium]
MSLPPPSPAPSDDHDGRARLFHEQLAAMPAALFQFDPRMRDGWYADRYFLRSAAALAHDGRDPVVRMQVFARQTGVVAGVFETVRLLQTQLASGADGVPADFGALAIRTMMDGDVVEPRESVMHITGPYRAFAHLETAALGVLARRSLIATNVRRTIDAAAGKPVIFMGARHDDWRVQTPDGYAALVGGAGSVSSNAGGAWWGEEGVGTMPHALIAAFGGDVVEATLAFTRYVLAHEPGVAISSLVDYRNDVIGDSLAVARAMRDSFGDGMLAAVRVDTSETLEDRAMAGVPDGELLPGERRTGVNSVVVRRLRAALDEAGFDGVGIIVSGGFKPTKIRLFEENGVPATSYGIGSSLLGHNKGEADGLVTNFDYTADLVAVDGREEHKVGRPELDNDRFVRLQHAWLDSLDAGRETAAV